MLLNLTRAMLLLVLAVIIIFAPKAKAGECGAIRMPPESFASHGTTLPHGWTARRIDYWVVNQVCLSFGAKAANDWRYAGCAARREKLIVVPTDDSGRCIERHEVAHAWGWPDDHPDAVFE